MSIDISLYGMISNMKLSNLKSILLGLCGEKELEFCKHELCWRPTYETTFGPSRNDDVALSLRSNVFTAGKNEYINWSQRKWCLIQRNQPEPPKHGQKLANSRIVHSCLIDGDAIAFLESLGYSYSNEYIMKGYEYWLGAIKILIYRVYQVKEKFAINTATPFGESESWIVQAQIPGCSQEQLAQKSQLLFQLALQLSGIVTLSVVDHTLLQTRFKYKET